MKMPQDRANLDLPRRQGEGASRAPEHRSEALRNLYPGYFAFVMATGILSTAADSFGLAAFSRLLLFIGSAGFAVLALLYALRGLFYPAAVRKDALDPARGFGYFTFVAGADVLAVRYLIAGDREIAAILGLVGAAAWLFTTYLIPLGFMLSDTEHPLRTSVNGSWLIWVVATQSVSNIASAFAPSGGALLAFLALGLWATGSVLYLVLITIITARLLLSGMTPAELSPPYWINMGATAITVLAGARLLLLAAPSAQLLSLHVVVLGVSFMLWAFGSFWIPFAVCFGIWRHGTRRTPLAYEPALWSMVFPLGMYGTATELFGRAAKLPWLLLIARAEIWVAYIVWTIVFLGMLRSIWRCASGRTA